MNDFDKARYQANIDLINLIADYLADNDCLRFGQALVVLGVIRPGEDVFNVEPQVMLERVLEHVNGRGDAK